MSNITASPNNGRSASLRSAKIRQSRTSHTRKTLSEMLCLRKTKRMGEKTLKRKRYLINMAMEKVVANNHEVVTTEQEAGCSNRRNTPFDYT